jgi:hypothetical protein
VNVSEEIQRLLVTTLKADSQLMALVNNVYDHVPDETTSFAGPKLAFVSFGPSDIVDDYAECIGGETHTVQIDVWSRQVGFINAKNIVDRIKLVLSRAQLSLTDNALVEINVILARIFRDPDGATSHGVLTVELMVEVA